MENKKHVLIVEDSEDFRDSLKFVYEEEGYEITEAHDGEAGLKLAMERKFDFICSDYQMPKRDGLSLLQAVKQSDGPNRDTPFFIFSGIASDIRKHALENGAHGAYDKLDYGPLLAKLAGMKIN